MGNSAVFNEVAAGYDIEFSHTKAGRLQRQQVHRYVEGHLAGKEKILEINCGTGEDLLWFCSKGYEVTATDISRAMVRETSSKIASAGYTANLKTLAFQELHLSLEHGAYSLVFSNFGGLNCIDSLEMSMLGKNLGSLMRNEAELILVVMGRFSWMETLYFIMKGKFTSAFRRQSKFDVKARVGKKRQSTFYYSPGEIARLLGDSYEVVAKIPVGLFVPPSYLNNKFEKSNFWLKWAEKLDHKLAGVSFLSHFSDHYLIHLKRK